MIAIYARQSVEKKDSISIESQIEMAKREVYTEDFKVYQDSGFSGKNTNRPAFTEMMEDIDSGLVEKVVVYRLDRISRSLVDFSDFISILEEKNIAFLSATEKFDTTSPMGRAMLYIVVVFAQLERETIAERIRDNYYARVKNGAWGGGPAPYGFQLVSGQIHGKRATILEPTAQLDVVDLIFDLYARDNTSLADVQKELIKQGITTSSGANFDSTKISSLLKNPAYVKADITIYNYYNARGAILANEPEEFTEDFGCILVGKRDANARKYKDVSNHLLAIGPHKGIIESSKFLYIQEKLSKNRQIKNTFKGKYSWLTGLVKCGHCGYAFSVRFGKTKEGSIPYFACSGRYLHRCCDVIQTHRVSEVEAEVERQLMAFAHEYKLTDKGSTIPIASNQQNKVLEIDGKIENLLVGLESGVAISTEYITKRIAALHQEKEALLAEYADQLVAQRQREVIPFNPVDWVGLSIPEKSALCRSMVEKVVLSDEGVTVWFW